MIEIEWKDKQDPSGFYTIPTYSTAYVGSYYLEIMPSHRARTTDEIVHYHGFVYCGIYPLFNSSYTGLSLEDVKERLFHDCITYQITYWEKMRKELNDVGD